MTRELGPTTLGRRLAVWGVASAVLGGLVRVLGPAVPRLVTSLSSPVVDFEPLLVDACQAVLLGCGSWLWAATTLVLHDAARGTLRSRAAVPDGLRRLVLGLCGLTLAGAVATPAAAAPPLPADPGLRDPGSAALVHGLPLPDRASAVGHVAHLLRRQGPSGPTEVRVRPGDTLWDLAAALLPPGAGDAAVDAAWRRLYHANRGVVGDDPDLIRPGQRLALPAEPRQEPT